MQGKGIAWISSLVMGYGTTVHPGDGFLLTTPGFQH